MLTEQEMIVNVRTENTRVITDTVKNKECMPCMLDLYAYINRYIRDETLPLEIVQICVLAKIAWQEIGCRLIEAGRLKIVEQPDSTPDNPVFLFTESDTEKNHACVDSSLQTMLRNLGL